MAPGGNPSGPGGPPTARGARTITRGGGLLVGARPLRARLDEDAAALLDLPPGRREIGLVELLRCFFDDDRAPLARALRAAWRGEAGVRVDVRTVGRSGLARWVECGVVRVRGPDGSRGLVGTLRDIHALKDAAARLRLAASQDSLTGLPHMQALRAILGARLARPGRLALLLIDVDRFHRVVGAFGYELGDRLLQAIAGRLRAVLRDEDLLARTGGDCFAVLAEDTGAPADVFALGAKLLQALDEPFDLGSARVSVRATIGAAIGGADARQADALLRNADVALRHAKRDEPRGIRVYSPEMGLDLDDRLELEHDLRQALARRELVLAYQPIVVHDAATLGDEPPRLASCEVLVRWSHPLRGIVPPSQFIALAEQIGLIGEIGRFALERALRQLSQWETEGLGLRYVSVNVAPAQFADERFVAELARLLERTGLAGDRLQLEITEGTMMADPAHAGAVLREIKSLGVRLALDDFGTGYSSLAYLGRYPIDVIKIDRSFVTPLDGAGAGASILSAIVALARAIGADLIAEGVETAAQRDALRQLGVRAMQGELYGRALPPSLFASVAGGFARRPDVE